MIKAAGRTGDGTPLAILGLSGENMTRLMADEPIRVNLAELGLPSVQILIVGGRTEGAITAQLQQAGLLTDDRPPPRPAVHECAIDDCTAQIPQDMLMCRPHWARVPRNLRHAVYRTYRNRQNNWSAYVAAVREARAAVQGSIGHG